MFRRNSISITEDKEFSSNAVFNIVTGQNEAVKKMFNTNNIDTVIDKKNGFTGLHYAIQVGNTEIINHFMELSANTFIKTLSGANAFDLSMTYHQKIIFDVTIKKKDETIVSLNKNIRELREDLGNSNNQNTYLTKTVDAANTKITVLKNQLDFDNRNNESLRKERDTLSLNLRDLKGDHDSIKKKYIAAKDEVDNLSRINTSIISENTVLKKRNEFLDSDNKKLNANLTDLNVKHQSLTDSHNKLEVSYESLLKRSRKV